MADQTPMSSSRSRWSLRRPELRAAVAAAAVVLVLVGVLAVVDPTGLLAPVGGHGMPWIRFGGVYEWAPLVVGVPVLLAGTALPVHAVARSTAGAGWLFFSTWVAVVGAVALAAAATGFTAALPLVGPH